MCGTREKGIRNLLSGCKSTTMFYKLFQHVNGELINGDDLTYFENWTPQTPELPRWAIMKDGKLITYRNDELKPILGQIGVNLPPGVKR